MTVMERFKAKSRLMATRRVSESQQREDRVQARLQAKAEFARTDKAKYAQYAEIHRVLELPMYDGLSEAEYEEYNRMNVLASAYDSGFRLFPVQADAVSTYEMQGTGGFFPIGVGFGKTAITLMISHKAWSKGLRKMLLLVPPQVLAQLVTVDIRWARTRIVIDYPIHVLGGLNRAQRLSLARSGKKGLYILPYSYLSVKDTTDMLEAIAPEIIIADEVQYLANRNSARTKRLFNYINHNKDVEGVALSGTITSKTIQDYHHLSTWCCKDKNFLPNSVTLAHEWAAIIDAQASAGGLYEVPQYSAGALRPLLQWARNNFPKESFDETIPGFRKAFKFRMRTSPCVVSSGDAAIGTSLIIENRPVPDFKKVEGWDKLEKHINDIEELWLTPNGDEIEHAIHTWKWLYELASGFYNELTWPTPETLANRRGISAEAAEDLLERAKRHHEAGQDYARTLRAWLDEKSSPRLDTPLLVAQSMSQHGPRDVGYELYSQWQRMHSLDFEGRPERDSRAVRVCPFKINHAVAYARDLADSGKGGIFWVYHQEVGAWLRDAMVEAGLEDHILHCPAGDMHNKEILDPENRDKLVVASMTAHGTGKNLQHFQHQMFVQWPRQAVAAEQTIGRTHRSGQVADELTVMTCNTLEFDHLNFAACINDALYIHQTTGNRQKLIYSSYSPTMPKIFPSAALLERGAGNKRLSREQEAILKDRFEG